MKFWGGVVRGLGVAAFVLGGSLVGMSAGALLSVTPAFAQSSSSIVVQGNRRVDAETIRSYFRTGPGERLDAIRIEIRPPERPTKNHELVVRLGEVDGANLAFGVDDLDE